MLSSAGGRAYPFNRLPTGFTKALSYRHVYILLGVCVIGEFEIGSVHFDVVLEAGGRRFPFQREDRLEEKGPEEDPWGCKVCI